jgi:isoleucyl-tRNA synthetase
MMNKPTTSEKTDRPPKAEGKPNYRATLNLPRDVLPMRANLPQREPEFQRFWHEAEIYRKSLEKDAPRGLFILHDGPPYSNGNIHVGHALNKLLKDFITRHKTMQGYRSPYVPGWDNHGMPIEYAVSQAAREKGETPDRVELRRRCRSYAERFVDIQREQFRRLGIRGDWDRPYLTMSHNFEARIVEVFAELALQGYMYRGLRPILWCPYDETALAEAEVEYSEKTSPSIYVRFPLADDPNGLMPAGEPNFTIIWTTTPWTIPANLAVAFHPDFEYVIARANGANYLLAEALLGPTMDAAGIGEYEIVSRHRGRDLDGIVFKHPLHELDGTFDRTSPAVLADYVTLETGTGVVHTAPGHGEEDFRTGRQYGLPVLCPVDAQGRFTAEAGPFQGKSIRPGDADGAVLEALHNSGNLLHREPYRHNYPHCWRCRGPLIFRTTVQWFMNIDHSRGDGTTHRERCLQEIDEVRWVPPDSVQRIRAMVAGRPDWCLSRQRAWGVAIPVFYCNGCGEPILTEESLGAAVRVVREQSADAWFTVPAEQILPEGFTCPHCGAAEGFEKEADVLDVWFDSGSTWTAVLESDQWPELQYPADVYLEGSDQHRGWFNSSLMLSVAVRGAAPYRIVITNGWTLDPHGEKMSKARGNVVSPLEVIEQSGADLLRLWVSSVDYFDDVRVGGEILDHVRNVFLRVRNTLRFLVGNLADFDPRSDLVPDDELEEIDRWALHRTAEVLRVCGVAYEGFVYHDVFHQVQNFCAVDLGGFYLDVIKDRLYCSLPDAAERRSAQTALYRIADHLARLLAPILVHVAEEVWQALPGARERWESVHLAPFPDAHDGWRDEELGARWQRLREVRDRVNAAIEPLKPKAKNDPNFVLKSSLEAQVTLQAGPDWHPLLDPYQDQLAMLLMVPPVVLQERGEPGLGVEVHRAAGVRCERCWLVLPDVGARKSHPDLCARCTEAVAAISEVAPAG